MAEGKNKKIKKLKTKIVQLYGSHNRARHQMKSSEPFGTKLSLDS